MSFQLKVHHIRCSVKNVEAFTAILRKQLNFIRYATSTGSSHRPSAHVMRHCDVIFIVDQRTSEISSANEQGFCCGNTAYPVDTVCDICLTCPDIKNAVERVRAIDCDHIITDVTETHDSYGTVKHAVVRPPVGNFQHTLVDLSGYRGPFLPGFELVGEPKVVKELTKLQKINLIQTIDHVAFVLGEGQSDAMMRWYGRCLGFNRLMINLEEDEKEGFLVQEGEQGLRLKAMFAPLNKFKKINNCAEPHDGVEPEVPKFVFCEALGSSKSNQISHFMRTHHGAGVQHIAFSTTNIVKAVSQFQEQGLNCILPPEMYYSEVLNQDDISHLGYKVDTLKENNILMESHVHLSENSSSHSSSNIEELDKDEQLKQMNSTSWFILQAFTSPIFEEKTLFFEIIQRFQTLSGFGAGNIGSLFRAVQKELFH